MDKEFDVACGVGVVVEETFVAECVRGLLMAQGALQEERYRMYAALIKLVKDDPRLKWADGKVVKNKLDQTMLELLGPKDERDAPVKGGKVWAHRRSS